MLISCEGTRPFPAPSRFTGTAQIFGKKDPAEGTDAEISLPILSCFPTECPRKNAINEKPQYLFWGGQMDEYFWLSSPKDHIKSML